jgi:NAD(P)-dependent dehydrogenase (short-subunit alcohol dehydrogenase family)
MQVSGARILVTGGGRRLGAEIAVGLAEAGADVAITYRTSAGGARDVVERIHRAGRNGAAHAADLAEPAQARAVVGWAAAELGGLDAIVHAASGGFRPIALADITPELFDEAIGATLRGALFLAQAAEPVLTDGGAIVLIGDIAGVAGWPSFLPHVAAKGALRGLTRGLAKALGPAIRVSIVHPGTVLLPDGDQVDSLALEVPLQRVGEPSDVLGAIVYLLEAPFVTGAELVVDGGRLIR